jgi:hypothetical protein
MEVETNHPAGDKSSEELFTTTLRAMQAVKKVKQSHDRPG